MCCNERDQSTNHNSKSETFCLRRNWPTFASIYPCMIILRVSQLCYSNVLLASISNWMEKVCFCADCGHRSILALPYCIIMHALPHCDMPFPFRHTHTLFCIRRWSTTESCLLYVGCHQNKKYKYKIKNRSFWIERHAWWKSGLDFAAVAVVRRFNGYSICCWLSAKVSSSAFGARHTWCNILDLDSSLVWESIIIICDTHFCSDSIACRRALQEFLIRAANHHRKKSKLKRIPFDRFWVCMMLLRWAQHSEYLCRLDEECEGTAIIFLISIVCQILFISLWLVSHLQAAGTIEQSNPLSFVCFFVNYIKNDILIRQQFLVSSSTNKI